MSIQYVNTGSSPNKGDGDSLRVAFTKINRNFNELLTFLGSTTTDVTLIANNETRRLLVHNRHSGIESVYNTQANEISLTVLNRFDQDLNTDNSVTFSNLAITNTATFGGDIDVGGTIKVGIIQGYDDFTIIKEDANGLHLRLRNTLGYSFSALEINDHYFGGLTIAHQNSDALGGDYYPGNEYIYGRTPSNTLNIGRYSDINFYADQSAYGQPGAILNTTASIKILSTNGNVIVGKDLVVASSTNTGSILLGTTPGQSKLNKEYIQQVGTIYYFSTSFNGTQPALTGNNFFFLPLTAESSNIEIGWTVTLANGVQQVLDESTQLDIGNGNVVWYVSWDAGLTYESAQVWPISFTSPNYQETVRRIVLTPDMELPEVNWKFGRNGTIKFPDGTSQSTAYPGILEGTSTFYKVSVTSTDTTTVPTTGALVVAGGVGIGENLHVGGVGYFGLESTILLENPLAVFTDNANGYVQIQIQNTSNGTSASSDFIATTDDGTDQSHYIDLGINNSQFDSGLWTVSGPYDGYLYVNSGNLTLGTDTPGRTVKVHVGGIGSDDVVAVFSDPLLDSNSPTEGSFTVNGGVGIAGKLHVRDVVHIGTNTNLILENPLIKAGANIDGYVQIHIQNQSGGYSASSDFIATTNDGSDTEHYIDLGINNSGFSSVDWTMSGPHDGYLYVNDGNLTVGTDTAGKQLKINIGGVLAENIVAVFDAVGTASTSTTTGALTVAGGIGVAGDIVSHNLIPAADLTYDLGTTSSQWRSLYVGTSTIYLGGIALSVAGGSLTVDGTPVQGGGVNTTSTLVNDAYTVSLSTTGNLTIPGIIIGTGNLSLASSQGSVDIGRFLRVRDGDIESHLHIDSPDNNTYDLIFGDDSKYVRVDHTGTVVIGNNGDSNTWTFALDGSLTIPGLLSINDNIGLDPASPSNIISISPTGEGWAYLQIPKNSAATNTNVRLHNDAGTIEIQTGNAGDGTSTVYKTWLLDKIGILTFPDGTTSTGARVFANSSSYKIQTIWFDGISGNSVSTYEFGADSITIPGNGVIYNAGQEGYWSLDGANQSFTFPNSSGISYGLGNAGLTVDDLKIQAINTGNVVISSNGNDWIFGPTGLTVPTFAGSPSIVTIESFSNISLGSNLYYWNFGSDGDLTLPSGGDIVFDSSATSYIYGVTGIEFADGTTQTTAYKSTSGSWTLATGSNTVSITVPLNGNYQMWVNGNIPNGIVEWNATVNVSNPNVPAIGSQYAWYYAAGNALVLTAIPDQIEGTAGVISTSTSYVGNTANVFTFGITNNSTSSQVVNWGYTTL